MFLESMQAFKAFTTVFANELLDIQVLTQDHHEMPFIKSPPIFPSPPPFIVILPESHAVSIPKLYKRPTHTQYNRTSTLLYD